jgi:TolB-like protein/Tfp pilus assembly protein PilF
MSDNSFFRELRKRKVFQTAAIYVAVAFGVVEIMVTVVEQLFLPQWVSTLAVIGFVMGFPIAMFLAWTFDLTREGLQRTAMTSRRGKASIAGSIVLLIAGTAGLFFLIKPSLQNQQAQTGSLSIVPNSIAVLPFDNSGLDPKEAYLANGLSDELRDQLGRISGIRIAARSSSIAARDQKLDALAISTKLGVANLVEGSVRRQGNNLKVSVQLIEGASGLSLWSEIFDRSPNELLIVQQTIAEAVARIVLPGAETVVAEPATRDSTANELMWLARSYDQQVRDRQAVDVDTMLKAVSLYREAIEADPGSALAYSRLAGALLYLGELDAAEAPIFKALSLNPNLSEVQNTLGEFYWVRGLPEANTAFARAVELNPNNPDALLNYANILWHQYDLYTNIVDDLATLYRRALDLDRLSLRRHAALGDYLGKEGRVEETRLVIRDVQELFDNAESYRLISWLTELNGELDKAIGWTIRARDLEPDNPDHQAKLAELYASIGDIETSLRLEPEPSVGLLFLMRSYPELIDIAEFLMIEEPGDMEVRYLLAFAYVTTGQTESAIHVLKSTGLPDSMFSGVVRTVSEIEAFFTLINALAALNQPDSNETARSLAEWNEETPWWGDISWQAVFRGCNLAILGRHEDALKMLSRAQESNRLVWPPHIYDSYCFQQYAEDPTYLEILRKQEERRTALRKRLPATLAEFGVSL